MKLCDCCGQPIDISEAPLRAFKGYLQYSDARIFGLDEDDKVHKVDLTKVESIVFAAIMKKDGRLANKDFLAFYYNSARNTDCDDKIIDVYVCKIRKKLKGANFPFKITTVHGMGYKIERA